MPIETSSTKQKERISSLSGISPEKIRNGESSLDGATPQKTRNGQDSLADSLGGATPPRVNGGSKESYVEFCGMNVGEIDDEESFLSPLPSPGVPMNGYEEEKEKAKAESIHYDNGISFEKFRSTEEVTFLTPIKKKHDRVKSETPYSTPKTINSTSLTNSLDIPTPEKRSYVTNSLSGPTPSRDSRVTEEKNPDDNSDVKRNLKNAFDAVANDGGAGVIEVSPQKNPYPSRTFWKKITDWRSIMKSINRFSLIVARAIQLFLRPSAVRARGASKNKNKINRENIHVGPKTLEIMKFSADKALEGAKTYAPSGALLQPLEPYASYEPKLVNHHWAEALVRKAERSNSPDRESEDGIEISLPSTSTPASSKPKQSQGDRIATQLYSFWDNLRFSPARSFVKRNAEKNSVGEDPHILARTLIINR